MDYLKNYNLVSNYDKKNTYYQYLTVATFKRNKLEKNKKYTLQIKNKTSEQFQFYVCENCFVGAGNIKITLEPGETKKTLITSITNPWNWDNALIKSTRTQTVKGNFEMILIRGDYTNKDIPDYILPVT